MLRTPDGQTFFTPTNLTVFMENPFITWMDRFDMDYRGLVTPDPVDEQAEIIAQHGIKHELNVLKRFEDDGRDLCVIPTDLPFDARLQLTMQAMEAGREIIYQAALRMRSQPFQGLADFLIRRTLDDGSGELDRPSLLGNHCYTVADSKLANSAKPAHIIQLCCYAEMLMEIQGHRPKKLLVMLGNGQNREFYTESYFYYYRQMQKAFLEQQNHFDRTSPPELFAGDDFGRWASHAKELLREADHLSLVANIRKGQIEKLQKAGIQTMSDLADLADASSDQRRVPKRMEPEIFNRLCRQAQLQKASQGQPEPAVLMLRPEPGSPRQGLQLLPPLSDQDVYFDMEGYPLMQGGLEYLFGAAYYQDGQLRYKDWWAHDREQERKAFESFIDWIYSRWKRDPEMHVYHYAAYEVTAMKKLMGNFATREVEVDDLLRNGVFIDLYKVVTQSMLVGEPSYSIKNIEHLYAKTREGEVTNAMASIIYYERWLEGRALGEEGPDWLGSDLLEKIRHYNEEDCESTYQLVVWLRERQLEAGISWVPPLRNEEDPEKKSAKNKVFEDAANLAEALRAAIPADANLEESRWKTQALLAHLLTFHHREEKPFWWSYFDRCEMSPEQMYDDLECLAGLTRTRKPGEQTSTRSNAAWVYEYSYDEAQETKLKSSDECRFLVTVDDGSTQPIKVNIMALDTRQNRVQLKLGQKELAKLGGRPPERINLIYCSLISPNKIVNAIIHIAREWQNEGTLPWALDDFINRRRPRLEGNSTGSIIQNTADLVAGTLDVVRRMQGTTLCIQGPPGTGKTYTSAMVILELIKAGRTVGITSNSHKAINNLMKKIADIALASGVSFKGVKVGLGDNEELLKYPTLQEVDNLGKIAFYKSDHKAGYRLVGGTAWKFCDEQARGQLDYLFIDEAGQVSLANLVGMSASTENIVLMGDQMQLGQPTQGSHPENSGDSLLEYYLEGQEVISREQGIFLDTTRRLHPQICEFISRAVYNGELHPHDTTRTRKLQLSSGRGGFINREAGIIFIPVEHTGRTQGSQEEIDVITEVVEELLGCRYLDEQGSIPLTLKDILLVAPFNMQVRRLELAMNETFHGSNGFGARVGSVDKFQGQEAPVVIISMCASSGNDSPRGIDFLFCKNRMNVALSRAQSLAIVVGNPHLAETRCASIEQMALINLFCWLIQEYSGKDDPELFETV